jgi:hypothetical protein
LAAFAVCGAACKEAADGSFENALTPPVNSSYEQLESDSSNSDSSYEETKTEAVQSLENKIAALPTVSELTLAHAGAVAEAEAAFAGLTETEKATVENYGTLFLAIERMVFLNNVQGANAAIAALPDVESVTLDDAFRIEEVYHLIGALGEDECMALAEYDKLIGCHTRLLSLRKIARVNELIAYLPTPDVIDESNLAQIDEAAAAFAELTEEEQAEVQKAGAIDEARAAVTASYWKDAKFRKHYVVGKGLTFNVNLKQNTVAKLTADGEEISAAQYAYADGILTVGEELLQTLTTGMHTFELTDSRDKSFRFIVGVGYEEKSTAYFDFDVIGYTSPAEFGVPCQTVEDGIDGRSGRFTKPTALANVFGFFKDGNFGFVPYVFKSGATYTLSFDIKVLDGTAENWWMPIFFGGGKGDVVYVRQTKGEVYLQEYNLDALNAKHRQSVVENGDGSYRVTVTFTLREDVTYENLEFASFDGAVDILLDNVLLIEE